MKRTGKLLSLRRSISHHFLLRSLHLLEAASMFLLVSAFLAFALYLLGNFQSFLEETQLSILLMVQVISILGFVVSLYYFFFLLSWIVQRKRIPWTRIIYSLITMGISLLLAAGALLIQDFSRGIGGPG